MSARREALHLPWDACSDQPARVHGATRRRLRRGAWRDWLTTAAIGGVGLPGVALTAAGLPRPSGGGVSVRRDHLGVGISPLDHDPSAIADLLAELECKHILVRFEWRRMHRWDELATNLARIDRPALAVLVQDRAAVCDHRRWRAGLARFYRSLPPQVEAVQALQAVNRLKWGCATVGEALPLAELAARAHHHHAPHVPLIGSSVIDFEPLASLRSLVSRRRFLYHAMAALLYVDRRGGPDTPQYRLFDLQRKVRTLAAIAAASPHVADHRLWLTEVNWPLRGVGSWAPTSQTEAVDEATAGRHLRDYCRQAIATGLVRRIYPWQLIARGYGLVDPHGLRRRAAFTELASLLRSR